MRLLFVAILALTGCKEALESPPPTVESAAPALVCNDQLITPVTIAGANLTPLPIDLVTDDPKLVLPELHLELASELDGGDADGAVDMLDYITWLDRDTMEISVEPLVLDEGVYDLRVVNADTQESTTAEILAVAPPPTLAAVTANLECVEQSDQGIVLDGTGILVVEGTLPTVAVGPLTVDGEATDDCFDLAGPVAGQSCKVLDTTLPMGSLDPGVYDVSITNPETAQCVTVETVQMEIVPRPTLSDVQPRLECVAQADQVFDLSGADFLVLADGTLPMVTLGSYTASADSASGCAPLAGPAGGEKCTGLVFTLPTGAEQPGIHDVVVTNPPPADCFSTDAQQVELVPPPSLTSVDANLECIDQADQTLTLTGTDFVVLADGTTPTVTVGSWSALADSAQGCMPLYGPAGGETCTELTILLPVGAEVPGVHDVFVTNPAPADCISEQLVQLEIVAKPTVSDIEPTDYPGDDVPGTCIEQGDRAFEITGTGFVVLADGTPPIVDIGGATVPSANVTGTGCTPLTGPAGGESCPALQVVLPANAEVPGVHDVVVTNPVPAECFSEETLTLEAFPVPVLTAVADPLICGDQPTQLTFTGTDLYVVGGVYPTVTIGGFSAPATGGTCTALTGSVADQVCTELTLTVNPGDLGIGLLPVSVDNPPSLGCTSTDPVTLEAVGAPTVTVLSPPGTCDATVDVDIVVSGSGFLDLGGATPTVDIGGIPLAGATVSDCNSPLSGAVAGTACDTLSVTIPGNTLPTNGDYDLRITNPAPADCAVVEVFSFADPPSISAIDPPQLCFDPTYATTFDIYGSSFATVAVVSVDGIPLTTTFIDDTHLQAEIPGGMFSPGLYDVTVDNGSGGPCSDTAVAALEITELPIVFYVDPPIVPNVIPITATAFVSGINGNVTDVEIEEVATGTVTTVPFRWDPVEPAVIEFDLSAGLPEGDYDLVVTDATGCVPVLDNAFFVEADTNLTLVDIDPGYGWTSDDTAVTLFGSGTPAFENPPRVYLSPIAPGPTTTASELRAVSWVDGATLDAVVAPGLAPDLYNVVVVNPTSGDVGILPSGFEVLADQPPYVDAVSPSSVPSQLTTVTLLGGGFGDPLVGPTPVVDLLCYDPSADSCASANNGAYTPFTGLAVTAWDSSSVDVEIPGGAIGGGVCVVTVTKPSDGTTASYSAVSVTNPAQNLYPWKSAPSMTTARAGTMATAGRVTRSSRYLYALGGENPADGPLGSVERARVDAFGNVGTWVDSPASALPVPVVNGSVAQVGRYIYVVGGSDGGAPTAEVWRAQVLDPLEAPEMTNNISITIDPIGLPEGTRIYRVSALFDATHDDNPGGESLASDPFVVRLPSVAPDNLQLELEWTEVPGAAGYRIYRSDSGTGNEQWLADELNGSADTTFTDVGDPTDPMGVRPIPVGALGNWSQMASMSIAREGACVSWGGDPADPSMAYLYAGGGHDGAAAHSSIEYLPITLVSEHDQDAGSWAPSANAMQSGRWLCSGYRATHELHSRVTPGDTWIYFGSGDNGVGGSASDSESGRVGPGGELLDFQPVRAPTGRAGYGAAAASNFLYAFGGSNGGPGQSADSAEICINGIGGCNGLFAPVLKNWNAAGISMCSDRYRLGSAQESSVIFAVGGDDGTGATNTVDYTQY